MLEYSVMSPEGILVLKPHSPLSQQDFDGVRALLSAYLEDHDKLHGVLIQSKKFPGWENFDGFTAHMHFVRDNHDKVERIAVVTDSPAAPIAETIGNTFTSAEVKHFPFPDEALAMHWLTGKEAAQ
jgi:hypothetical protein